MTSPPAHSPRSPAPEITTARTPSSWAQALSVRSSSVTMTWLSELMAFGRLRVRYPTPPSTRLSRSPSTCIIFLPAAR